MLFFLPFFLETSAFFTSFVSLVLVLLLLSETSVFDELDAELVDEIELSMLLLALLALDSLLLAWLELDSLLLESDESGVAGLSFSLSPS